MIKHGFALINAECQAKRCDFATHSVGYLFYELKEEIVEAVKKQHSYRRPQCKEPVFRIIYAQALITGEEL